MVANNRMRGEGRRQRKGKWRLWAISLLLSAGLALGLMPVGAQAAHADASQYSRRQGLQSRLDQIVAAGVPGVAALVRDQQGEWQAASGMADLRAKIRMRPDLRFRVGSITKMFVSTVVLQLEAEGKLKISDTVERWFPGLVPAGNRITIRQLLNHTSGLADYASKVAPPIYTSTDARYRYWSPEELVAVAATLPPTSPPGQRWSYSNTNYIVAGMIAERAGGSPLQAQLERRILRPLGLTHTSFPLVVPSITGAHAKGYVSFSGQLVDFTNYSPSWLWAAGALISTPADLARFERALSTGRLLGPAQLREMRSGVDLGAGASYGLALQQANLPCGRILGHGGVVPGFTSLAFSSPNADRQVMILINLDANGLSPQAASTINAAFRWGFCPTSGVGERASAASQPEGSSTLSQAVMAQLASPRTN